MRDVSFLQINIVDNIKLTMHTLYFDACLCMCVIWVKGKGWKEWGERRVYTLYFGAIEQKIMSCKKRWSLQIFLSIQVTANFLRILKK